MKITFTKPFGYIVESYDSFEYYKSTKEMLLLTSKTMDSEQRKEFCKGVIQMHKQDHNVGDFGDIFGSLIWSKKE